MDESYDFRPQTAPQRKSGWRLWLVGALLAFALGVWLTLSLTRPATDGSLLGSLFNLRSETVRAAPSPLPSATRTTAEVAAAVERVEEAVEQAGGLDVRVAQMEQRLTRLDLQSQAAAGNAARAEGLLIAFATRRALERGAPLGYLADQLQLRFGDARPNAVRTVIEAAQQPVTVDELLARLDGLSPALANAPADEDLLSQISRELSQAFVVRREDTPSPAAERRLERARLFLQSGRAEAAVAEVRSLPNAVAAAQWIRDATRYAAAHKALELLETAAVLEERDLRDGAGDRVE